MNQVKKGDTVRLKSGGPLMTVVVVDGEFVTCQWFKGDRAQEGAFEAAALEASDDKPRVSYVRFASR